MARPHPPPTLVAAVVLAASLAGCVSGLDPGTAGAPAAPFSTTAVFPGTYDASGRYARTLHPGDHGILAPEIVEIASPVDGATIQMGIVRPDVPPGTRVPVIAVASPYFDPMTPEALEENPQNDRITFFDYNHYEYYAARFVPHGYAVAFVATRGTSGSGGCAEWFGPKERDDVSRAVTWLGEAEWSNGNVGMIGISYEGTTPWMVAATGNPHLKTIVPIAGYPDYYGTASRNGTMALQGASRVVVFGKYGLYEGNPTNGRSAAATLSTATCPEIPLGLAGWAHAGATSGRDALGYWKARDHRAAVAENYRGSALVVSGFGAAGDPLQAYPWTRVLEERGLVVKHLIGQWRHTLPDAQIFTGSCGPTDLSCSDQPNDHRRWDFAEILLRWFDRWLKEDAGVDLGPAVQVEDTSGLWRNEAAWPPADAAPRALRLALEGRLAEEDATPTGWEVVSPERPPVAFATPPLAEALRFAGLPTLHASVVPEGPGGVLVARLHVEADGERTPVGLAVMDLRVADGGEEPRPVAPGAPLRALMEFVPLDVHVPAGASLVLTIEPLRASGAGRDDRPILPVRLEVGGDASVLTLPTLARGPDAFFEPPGDGP